MAGHQRTLQTDLSDAMALLEPGESMMWTRTTVEAMDSGSSKWLNNGWNVV